jgi:hypothetical protein
MKKDIVLISILMLNWAASLGAYTFTTGFSGAPGSYGLCASTCHGVPGGTITITGFPARYQPGQTYTVKIYGDSIRQFNGSCRVGTDTLNAGTITADYNTEVYNVFGETNGIHLLVPSSDSGAFLWTAPDPGVDTVRLFIAGEQGIMSIGPNTELVFVSAQATGVEEQGLEGMKERRMWTRVTPNPFQKQCAITYGPLAGGPARLSVFDYRGHVVRVLTTYSSRLSPHTFIWDGRDVSGRRVPQGVYLFRLEQGNRSSTGKAVLIR